MKNIIKLNFLVISALFLTCLGMTFAQGTVNDLLKMDLKKSSVGDAVDVTLYTTGDQVNSVVSRKSANTYVVLLPYVNGSQSVVPSLGGVKDLITDVTVKKVDDGLGGYTKITFNTTKPVKIQTFTKQTSALTQAQQDYKALIAKNNTVAVTSKSTNSVSVKNNVPAQNKNSQNIKNNQSSKEQKPVLRQSATVQNTTKKQEIAQKTLVPAQKTAVQSNTKQIQNTAQTGSLKDSNTKTQGKNLSKNNSSKSIVAVAPTKVSNTENASANKKAKEDISKISNNSMNDKTLKNGDISNKMDKKPIDNNVQIASKEIKKDGNSQLHIKNEKNIRKSLPKQNKHSRSNLSVVLLAGAFCMFALFIFAGFAGVITNGINSKRNRLEEYNESQNSSSSQSQTNEKLQTIMEDKDSNWQEKYKQYTELNKQRTNLSESKKLSYVADMASSKGVIVPDEKLTVSNMNDAISKMEHVLSQTPSENTPPDFNKFYAEDEVISNHMSEVKLRSFARNVDLAQSSRNLVTFEEIANRKNKPLKESKYVNLQSNPLTISKRKSLSSGLNFANIVRSNRVKTVATSKIDNIQEDYVISSINEYMNLLDKEKTSSQTYDSSTLGTNVSRMTNPMSKESKFSSKNPKNINGLNIKSSYNIDNNKNIYLVDLDGTSAIIGKIGNEIFVLKKFERTVNNPMQVRLDYGKTYIVRVGSFKCLVDVSEDKMGTLLEI